MHGNSNIKLIIFLLRGLKSSNVWEQQSCRSWRVNNRSSAIPILVGNTWKIKHQTKQATNESNYQTRWHPPSTLTNVHWQNVFYRILKFTEMFPPLLQPSSGFFTRILVCAIIVQISIRLVVICRWIVYEIKQHLLALICGFTTYLLTYLLTYFVEQSPSW